MALYEHIFLARQDLPQQKVDQLVEAYKELIENKGGKVGRIESWGLRPLAYRIQKNRKAHYILMDLDAPNEAIEELEHQERINENVLRYITVRVKEHEEGPSAMLSRREREDRPQKDDENFRRARPDQEKGDE